MQTVAVFTAPADGVLSINGRFAGEAGPERPLIMPVTPEGILYVQFAPFVRRYRHCAHRIRISGGKFDMSDGGDMCRMVEWPGGICEFEIIPPTAYPPESEFGTIDGRDAALLRGERPMLRIGGALMALPDGALMPDAHMETEGVDIYMGKCAAGRYAAVYGAEPMDCISAGQIEITGNGLIRGMTDLGDTVGHGVLETYRPSAEGIEHVSGEFMWMDGGPKWPDSPEKTVIAAMEAAMLGLDGEAAGYFAPAMRGKADVERYVQEYDAVMPMRYAPPSGRNCVALVKRVSENAARVTPLYYRATAGGMQGGWLIEEIGEEVK